MQIEGEDCEHNFRYRQKPGDEILEIDGKSTIGVSLDDAAGKMRGKLGTVVILGTARSGVRSPT